MSHARQTSRSLAHFTLIGLAATLLSLFAGCRPKLPSASTTQSMLVETGEPFSFRVTDGSTYFKRSKAPAYQLTECSDRCRLNEGDIIRYQGELKFEDNHLVVNLADHSIGCCNFQTGYLYGQQYQALLNKSGGSVYQSASGEPNVAVNGDPSNEFPYYDAAYGQRLANAARNPDGHYLKGRCYQAVADALDRALGAAQNYGRLNLPPYCARTFSDNWVPSIHERQFRLRKIATSDKSILPRLPVGSVIVTGLCGTVLTCAGGTQGAGDIMVKLDSAGTTASFYTSNIRSGCAANAELLAVYIPLKL